MTDTQQAPGYVTTHESDGHAPRIINPGEGGWAPEPKVTQAELLLYGEFAGPVRLLGQAVTAAQDAYSLVCKHAREASTVDEPVHNAAVTATYALYEQALAAHRETARKAIGLTEMRAATRFEPPPSD